MVRTEGPAPYAPAATILSVIDRYRNRGLQTPIDIDVLARAGVTESLAPRTLQALKQLDLISEEGEPLESLERLARVAEPEFPETLSEILRSVYADVFNYVDPSEDGPDRVRDAFRGYTPRGQQGRMVSLFLGLCAAAGLVEAEPPKTRGRSSSTNGRASTRTTTRGRKRKGSSREQGALPASNVPPTVLGILAGLPEQGGTWTAERRELFMSAFTSVLDLEFRVVKEADEEVVEETDK